MKEELLKRYEKNPILTYKDAPFLCTAVYNPGAVKFGDQYLLLCRVEDGRRDNKLHVALSDDGYRFAPRCHKRFERCQEEPPVFAHRDSNVKCWLYEKS